VKLFDENWSALFAVLPQWEQLTPIQRGVAVTQIALHGYTAAAKLHDCASVLEAAGLLSFDREKRRVSLLPEQRVALKLLRAMHRHPVLEAPTELGLQRYIEEHFSTEEVQALFATTVPRGHAAHVRLLLARRLSGLSWLRGLLHPESEQHLVNWVSSRHGPHRAGVSLPEAQRVRALVEMVASTEGTMPLAQLVACVPDAQWAVLQEDLRRALACGVLFASLDRHTLLPRVGVWGPALDLLRKPATPRPPALDVVERFGAAIMMDDMTTVLAEIAAAPARVRAADRALFARHASQIEARLAPVPAWAAVMMLDLDHSRVDAAVSQLLHRRFLAEARQTDTPMVAITAAGRSWLALTGAQRLHALLAPLRDDEQRVPESAWYDTGGLHFFPLPLPWYRVSDTLDFRTPLQAVLRGLGNGFVDLEGLLQWCAETENPLLASAAELKPALEYELTRQGLDFEAAARGLWFNLVKSVIDLRLLPFGGAQLGRTAEGRLAIAITPVGQWLLGEDREFVYAQDAEVRVVVQPNFEVVMFGAAPVVEAALARVADRVGPAPGLAFRITRASVLRAVHAGATAEQVVELLASGATDPLPANVVHELRAWAASVRRAALSPSVLLEVDDEATAAAVMRLLPSEARRLTPTCFALPVLSAKQRAALLKRLRERGILIS
jgi:hypothetical protein